MSEATWTPEERGEVSKAIEKIPEPLLKHVRSLDRKPMAPAGPGHSSYDHKSGVLTFYDKGTKKKDGSTNKKQIEESVFHEVAHSLEKEKGLIDAWCQRVGWERGRKGWAKSPKNKGFVYDYGKKDPFEDFSTSFSMYFTNPKRLAKTAPDKFSFINELVIRNTKMKKKAEESAPISLEFPHGEELVGWDQQLPKTDEEKENALLMLTKSMEHRKTASKRTLEKRGLMLRGVLGKFTRSGLQGTYPTGMLQSGGIRRRLGGIAKPSKQKASGIKVDGKALT